MHFIPSALGVALWTALSNAQEAPPAEFTLSPITNFYQGVTFSEGNTGPPAAQSPRFAIYGPPGPDFDQALNGLESAYSCFVDTLGWRSTGLSNSANKPGYFKTNIYQVAQFSGPNIAGQQYTDREGGRGYVGTGMQWTDNLGVLVHEYGHVLQFHQKPNWSGGRPDINRAWWESLASFVSDYAANGDACAPARQANNVTSTSTNIDFTALVSNSNQVLVDASSDTPNNYKSWPFFMYLTNNPDQFPNLGRDIVRQMFLQWKTGETPLNTLQTIAGPSLSVQTIVASYWARVAYADLWHERAAVAFNRAQRGSRNRALNYANLDSTGPDTWRVKPARQPKYMGASMVPLSDGKGPVTVKVTAPTPFEARIAIRAPGYGKVRYIYVQDGEATVQVGQDDEVMLVVVNAPAQLVTFNPTQIPGSPADAGLDYSVTVTGATVGTGAAPPAAGGVRTSEFSVAGAVDEEVEEEVEEPGCGGEPEA
ncbi:hypothetical protein B9Z65_2690 [Elsinoe australis]|uniref:Uncharacterized protein n=1 Tax=Elsinoe australis TaxID=40998 RepID=A0A2P8A4B0_9PEZI|nr:hypothetical protein B9Z65_2690 [Elsinoe australis]